MGVENGPQSIPWGGEWRRRRPFRRRREHRHRTVYRNLATVSRYASLLSGRVPDSTACRPGPRYPSPSAPN